MISADLQSLTPGNLVILYELDLNPIGQNDVLRFHAGSNEFKENIIWASNTYRMLPIFVNGFEKTTSGTLPRPKISIANISGIFSQLIISVKGLEGARLTRIRTFAKYIDAANFSSGNPFADPSQYIERDVWYVSRKSAENSTFLEYELAANFDLNGVKIPRRQIIQNVCSWVYKGRGCKYAGGPVADENDLPTSEPSKDRCGKRLTSCELRFGKGNVLPYGGFPGAGTMR